MIEQQLKEKHGFTDEEMTAFYQDLQADVKTYQDKNADVLDILYGFLDF